MEWVRNSFGLEPQWTLEPDIRAIESLAQKHLGARNKTTECRARFYAGGAFNKLFLIESSTGNFIMRVSMPVCPTYKTRSEVSTILWLRKRTQIPVPAIIAYDDTSINELGFEWILMEMMPGQSLYHRWRQIPIEDKENLVRTLAGYQYDLLSEQNRSRSIGNIYHVKDVGETLDAPQEIHCTEEMRFHIGRMVSLTFFWGDQAKATIPRGPFRNSLDWLQTRLDLTLEEQQSTLKHLDDEDDIETAEKAITLVKRLFTLLPAAFASQNPEPEQTALWHHDLSLSNILINDKNEITAIVDWECVSVQPLWRATQVPPFLVGRTRPQLPNRDDYADEDEEEEQEEEDDEENDPNETEHNNHTSHDNDSLNNEGKDELYWLHLMEHEQTHLRTIYLNELKSLSPTVQTLHDSSILQSSLEFAVTHCTNAFAQRSISEWLDDVEEKGVVRDLTDRGSI